MTQKQRQFKNYENNTRYWSGQSNKFASSMKNTDIKFAVENEDWSELIENAKKGLMRSAYNRDNNIFNPDVIVTKNNEFNRLEDIFSLTRQSRNNIIQDMTTEKSKKIKITT